MAATATLTPARALRRPRQLDLRTVFGVVLMLLAIGGSIAFWTTSSETRSILVATSDLPVGATLRAADLAVARVRVDDTIYQAAIPAEEQLDLVGKQVTEPVHAQQLLVRPQITGRPALGPDDLALSIPVNQETAAGGRVRPGDAVQVLVTTNKGKPESRTSVVLPRVAVYDVGYDERVTVVSTSGASDASTRVAPQGPLSTLTLVLSQDQAIALAQAKWNGELDVALLPPDRT